jgi:hypothetical protein
VVAAAEEKKMNLRDAAQQALEALWFANTQDWHGNATIWKAISTLQSALEQPEQRCEYIRTSGNTHWCALGVKNESQ